MPGVSFKYPPLPQGHTRLLRIAESGDCPLAHLESYSLDDAPRYMAISYCWGTNSTQHEMLLNDQSFSISAQVHAILNQVLAFKEKTSLETVWIDQICIDQQNLAEKADQINRMGEIYSQAEKVFIWLGHAADSSDAVIENTSKVIGTVQFLGNSPNCTRLLEPIPTAELLSEHLRHCYGSFFLRPWFRRLWTVQETLLAQELIVVCGSKQIDWDVMVTLAAEIGERRLTGWIAPLNIEKRYWLQRSGIQRLNGLNMLRKSMSPAGLDMQKFFWLIAQSRSRETTRPKDRVLAILGVAPPEVRAAIISLHNPLLPPSCRDLYLTLSKIMLESQNGFQFLAAVANRRSSSSLPSWCLDLGSGVQWMSLFSNPWSWFMASSCTRLESGQSRCDLNSNTLSIRGVRIDRVETVLPQTAYCSDNFGLSTEKICESIHIWHLKCLETARSVLRTPNGIPMAHLETLLAGSNPTLNAVKEAYELYCLRNSINTEDRRQWLASLSQRKLQLLEDFTLAVGRSCMDRPYISTTNRRLGLGPLRTQEGDVICIFYGAKAPFILRNEESETFKLVGDAYLSGIMYGGALTSDDRGEDEVFYIS